MRNTIIMIVTSFLFSGCSMYKKFESPDIDTRNLYRDTVTITGVLPLSDSTNMGDIPWNEMFCDTALQKLLEQGLVGNFDLQVAMLRIEEAEASLRSARLDYTPSVNLTPNGSLSSFDGNSSHLYQIPVKASWQANLFGGLHNANKSAKAKLMQSEAYKQAVQTQLIAVITSSYCTLLMLDRQVEIIEQTSAVWEKSIETMRVMKNTGMTNEAAIKQNEANYFAIRASLSDLQLQTRRLENALSVILGQTPQSITRGKWSDIKIPEHISVGVPVQLLSNRPDVKQAEMALASAYYNTNVARSAFYPNLTIDGLIGWTNNAGSIVVNPEKILFSTVGSLTGPVFNKGMNNARLHIAKAQQEEASLNFQKTVLNAGSEVSNALFQYTTAKHKQIERTKQIEALRFAVENIEELFYLGSSTYLEVLIAQQDLLKAQLFETSDMSELTQSVINLYQALGGGRK